MVNSVGILTWHYYTNYGSALQAYALQQTIESLGYNVKIINYRNPKYGIINHNKERLKIVLSQTLGKSNGKIGVRFAYPFLSFQENFFHQTRLYNSVTELNAINGDYDTIIFGSDQIWAPNVFNDIYMGSFISGESTKLVSYAASIGLNSIPDELVSVYKKMLARFKAISVREEIGKILLEEKCGIAASVVLDPTLLLSNDNYNRIERKPKQTIESKYLFCYFLNENHQYRDTVIKCAESYGLRIVGISQNNRDLSWMKILQAIGPQEFLWLIHHAEVVFTDSYHGTIFSILFQKKFYTFERFKSESTVNQNSRIYQLSKYIGTDSFIVTNTESIQDKLVIDWNSVSDQIRSLRVLSMNYLKGALS